jgi:long-chain acyl-CoA synthetase
VLPALVITNSGPLLERASAKDLEPTADTLSELYPFAQSRNSKKVALLKTLQLQSGSRCAPFILTRLMLDTLLDDTAEKLPLNPALIFQGKSYTYADLRGLTHRLTAGLIERGVQPGDRIAFLLPNCLEIVLCYYACFKIGAVAVPLNVRFPAELLQYAIKHSDARLLISEPVLFSQIEPIRPALPDVKQYYLTSRSYEFPEAKPFDELLSGAENAKPQTRSGNEPAAIYYTSGTTGLPKAVIHSHASLARLLKSKLIRSVLPQRTQP